MFLHLAVSHFVHKGLGVSASVYAGIHTPPPREQTPTPLDADTLPRVETPWKQTPPGTRHPPGADSPPAQCMLGDMGNRRAVRILLECIPVMKM